MYELHITVEKFPSITQTVDFGKYCQENLKCKANLIELSTGKYPLQLMLAQKHGLENDAAALDWASDYTALLRDYDHWDVVRVKVESALKKGPAIYFEAHWKFVLQSDDQIGTFNNFLVMHSGQGFLSSRNLLKDGVYYLSQRNYQVDHKAAERQFNAVSKKIELAQLPLEGVHYERVLTDSFPGLDEGWTL